MFLIHLYFFFNANFVIFEYQTLVKFTKQKRKKNKEIHETDTQKKS